jgi:hypothetical protein
MSDAHDEEVKEMMRRLLHVIDGDVGLKPEVAMPALLYATGYVLGHAGHGVPLSTIYLQICSDIEHSRAITSAAVVTQETIERMKEGA